MGKLPLLTFTADVQCAILVSSDYVIPLAIGLSCSTIILVLLVLITIVVCLICRVPRWVELGGGAVVRC